MEKSRVDQLTLGDFDWKANKKLSAEMRALFEKYEREHRLLKDAVHPTLVNTKFYGGYAKHPFGLYLNDILRLPDEKLEHCHAYIQWMFPLPEQSNFVPNCPLLTRREIEIFRSNIFLRGNIRRSYFRFLRFLGINGTSPFDIRFPDMWESENHNWLRITRCLRFLHLTGMNNAKNDLYDRLVAVKQYFPLMKKSFPYWDKAIGV